MLIHYYKQYYNQKTARRVGSEACRKPPLPKPKRRAYIRAQPCEATPHPGGQTAARVLNRPSRPTLKLPPLAARIFKPPSGQTQICNHWRPASSHRAPANLKTERKGRQFSQSVSVSVSLRIYQIPGCARKTKTIKIYLKWCNKFNNIH